MTSPLQKISIVVPAFNEERRLPDSVKKIERYMHERGGAWELVLVDDGSRDGTAAWMRSAAAGRPEIRVVSYWPNGGKGYAIRRGVLEATGDAVLVSDADLSTPIEELDRLLPRLDGAAVVIGSRALGESRIGVAQAWYRQWMGKTFNRLMAAITGLPFRDTQCGFKLFRGDAAKAIFAQAAVDRFAYDVEALLLANQLGYAIEEVPVRWDNSDDSRVRIVRDSSRMLFDILRMRLRVGRYDGRRG